MKNRCLAIIVLCGWASLTVSMATAAPAQIFRRQAQVTVEETPLPDGGCSTVPSTLKLVRAVRRDWVKADEAHPGKR